jgi:hypothetical protein
MKITESGLLLGFIKLFFDFFIDYDMKI